MISETMSVMRKPCEVIFEGMGIDTKGASRRMGEP